MFDFGDSPPEPKKLKLTEYVKWAKRIRDYGEFFTLAVEQARGGFHVIQFKGEDVPNEILAMFWSKRHALPPPMR